MSKEKRKLLVTSALPYANGPIHLGHLVEYLQTEIWCRFQRLNGNTCIYVCADDAHGTPIMLRARQEGIEPQKLIDDMWESHTSDFSDFLIEFDSYHTTHSPENRFFAESIYQKLNKNGHIIKKTICQAYDEEAEMFLPDRFIKGTCPVCRAEDQYGDACESCGTTYAPSELINPVSVVSGKPPAERDSEHYFFKLADFEEMLKEWTRGEQMQPEIGNKLQEWFEAGLRDWDISRDAPYWGFEIPGAPGKFFYVWMDAPIGYMASYKKFCDENGQDFNEPWEKESDWELYHFIGKDIAYFHTLFWPAMLEGAGLRTPTAVFAHGFLTVGGQKMSKSRGTFIKARTWLDHLNPELLRYYFAAKLGPGVDDIDLNLEDFVLRVNSDLVGKFVNIASRCAGFMRKKFDNTLSEEMDNPALYEEFVTAGKTIAASYEKREFSRAMRTIMGLADKANQYIDEEKPWVLVKDEESLEKAHRVCSQGINFFRVLMAYLKPVLPDTASRSEEFLNIEALQWDSVSTPLTGHVINKFKPLMTRVEDSQVAAVVADSTDSAQ
jgi:methionyl-tRNA synthetase